MNIFQIKTLPHGIQRFRQFLDEKFICIGWPKLHDLKGVSTDEIRDRIATAYNITGHKLGNALGQVNAFVNTMQTDDVVLISERNWVYVGTVGDYHYEPQYDNDTDAMCHRRPVEWTAKVSLDDLSSNLQRFLCGRNTISRFPDAYEESGLDSVIGVNSITIGQNNSKLNSLIEEALIVLESELKSEDPDRRLKAATELVRMKKI